MTTTISPAGPAPRWQKVIAWVGPVVLAIGFFSEGLWRSFPAPRALETLVLATIAIASAFALNRILRVRLASAIACIFGVALIVFAGPFQVAAAIVLAVSSACIGGWIVRDRADALTMLVGLAVTTGALGWLLPFPVHYRAIYIALLLVPIAMRREQCLADARALARQWRTAVDASPRIAAFAVVVIGLCSAGCWFPTLQYDDLAYHLGLPSQLVALHYYRLDAYSQLWALAPWAGDVAQAIAQIVAGREARGAVDAMWLLTILALVWRACRLLGADAAASWLAVAIAASQPLLANLCGGMQAELPATAAAMGLSVIVLEREAASPLGDALRFACIAALLIGLKAGFVAIILPLAIAFAWTHRERGFSIRTAIAFVVFPLLGGSSYFYATLLTGDPLYPLLADAFHSTYPSPQMDDIRWRADIGAAAPWSLTFNTTAYHEGWNGAAGVSLLGLFGASVLAFFARRTRIIAVCAILSFTASIVAVHYFRYTFPAVVMMIPPSLTMLAHVGSIRQIAALSCALVVVNLGYQSCSSWMLHVGGIKHRVLHDDIWLVDRFAATRDLARDVAPDGNVLFCSPSDPAFAEFAGRAFTVAHYDVELERDLVAADADASGDAWRRLFQRTQARYAMVSLLAPENPALRAALGDARLVREVGQRQLWELPTQTAPGEDLARTRDAARNHFRP